MQIKILSVLHTFTLLLSLFVSPAHAMDGSGDKVILNKPGLHRAASSSSGLAPRSSIRRASSRGNLTDAMNEVARDDGHGAPSEAPSSSSDLESMDIAPIRTDLDAPPMVRAAGGIYVTPVKEFKHERLDHLFYTFIKNTLTLLDAEHPMHKILSSLFLLDDSRIYHNESRVDFKLPRKNGAQTKCGNLFACKFARHMTQERLMAMADPDNPLRALLLDPRADQSASARSQALRPLMEPIHYAGDDADEHYKTPQPMGEVSAFFADFYTAYVQCAADPTSGAAYTRLAELAFIFYRTKLYARLTASPNPAQIHFRDDLPRCLQQDWNVRGDLAFERFFLNVDEADANKHALIELIKDAKLYHMIHFRHQDFNELEATARHILDSFHKEEDLFQRSQQERDGGLREEALQKAYAQRIRFSCLERAFNLYAQTCLSNALGSLLLPDERVAVQALIAAYNMVSAEENLALMRLPGTQRIFSDKLFSLVLFAKKMPCIAAQLLPTAKQRLEITIEQLRLAEEQWNLAAFEADEVRMPRLTEACETLRTCKNELNAILTGLESIASDRTFADAVCVKENHIFELVHDGTALCPAKKRALKQRQNIALKGGHFQWPGATEELRDIRGTAIVPDAQAYAATYRVLHVPMFTNSATGVQINSLLIHDREGKVIEQDAKTMFPMCYNTRRYELFQMLNDIIDASRHDRARPEECVDCFEGLPLNPIGDGSEEIAHEYCIAFKHSLCCDQSCGCNQEAVVLVRVIRIEAATEALRASVVPFIITAFPVGTCSFFNIDDVPETADQILPRTQEEIELDRAAGSEKPATTKVVSLNNLRINAGQANASPFADTFASDPSIKLMSPVMNPRQILLTQQFCSELGWSLINENFFNFDALTRLVAELTIFVADFTSNFHEPLNSRADSISRLSLLAGLTCNRSSLAGMFEALADKARTAVPRSAVEARAVKLDVAQGLLQAAQLLFTTIKELNNQFMIYTPQRGALTDHESNINMIIATLQPLERIL